MIDYLEQFFRGLEREQENLTLPARGNTAQPEPEDLPVKPRAELDFGESSPKQPRSVDIFRELITQKVEYIQEEPGQERLAAPISRPAVEGEAQNVECRLRREERRYDSGFYWY